MRLFGGFFTSAPFDSAQGRQDFAARAFWFDGVWAEDIMSRRAIPYVSSKSQVVGCNLYFVFVW